MAIASESVEASRLTLIISAVTVPTFFPYSSAIGSASLPVRIYSVFTYPFTLPDVICVHSPSVPTMSPTQPGYILPTTSASVDAAALTFNVSVIFAINLPSYGEASCAATTGTSAASVELSANISNSSLPSVFCILLYENVSSLPVFLCPFIKRMTAASTTANTTPINKKRSLIYCFLLLIVSIFRSNVTNLL